MMNHDGKIYLINHDEMNTEKVRWATYREKDNAENADELKSKDREKFGSDKNDFTFFVLNLNKNNSTLFVEGELSLDAPSPLPTRQNVAWLVG